MILKIQNLTFVKLLTKKIMCHTCNVMGKIGKLFYIFTNKYKTQNFKGKGEPYYTHICTLEKKKKSLYQPKKKQLVISDCMHS